MIRQTQTNSYPSSEASDPQNRVGGRSLAWLDPMKGFAIAWIFLNHLTERIFGNPYIANPTADWPSLADRIEQLRPIGGQGLGTIPVNMVRYIGWAGDQGVQLFLIASGFGLAWGLFSRLDGKPLEIGWFYRRRLARIYPLWLAAHISVAISAFLIGLPADAAPRTLLLSAVGIRFTPSPFYAITPAWWYVGLLLQLYLVFPLLWSFLQRRGPLALLVVSCVVAFAARGVGLLLFHDYVDAWQRGAIFITRLPEFAFGMSLAAWMHRSPGATDRFLREGKTLLLAVISYAAATFASLTWIGMTVAPFLLGVAAFVLLYALLNRRRMVDIRNQDSAGVVAWLGRHSFSIYLVHGLVVQLLIPEHPSHGNVHVALSVALAIASSLLLAILLEQIVEAAMSLSRVACDRLGAAVLAITIAGAATAVLGMVIAAELYVRRVDPQEVLGWGERASLQPDDVFGWKLTPSKTTHLRWESYDYHVISNALGFPGPQYPEAKQPGTLRILAVGDAFTSAEGVDTDQAWPRLLERELSSQRPEHRVEVLNFAITGYGPNQYAAVVSGFAPRFRPDLILIGLFVNDYEDVLRSDRAFRRSIGFQFGDQNGWLPLLTAAHLRQLAHLRIGKWRSETLRGEPDEHGYFLGNFHSLERHTEDDALAQSRVAERLQQIQSVAQRIRATVVIALFPAPVQVCDATHLAYYPAHVDLNDAARFDLDKPQRVTRQVAQSLGMTVCDLLPVLRSAPQGCPFQPQNMHWTPAGHKLVASYLAKQLVSMKLRGFPADQNPASQPAVQTRVDAAPHEVSRP